MDDLRTPPKETEGYQTLLKSVRRLAKARRGLPDDVDLYRMARMLESIALDANATAHTRIRAVEALDRLRGRDLELEGRLIEAAAKLGQREDAGKALDLASGRHDLRVGEADGVIDWVAFDNEVAGFREAVRRMPSAAASDADDEPE